jgi:hypothetical protein
MSGGHYDYMYARVDDLATQIEGDVLKFSTPGTDGHGSTYEAVPLDILTHMESVARGLHRYAKLAHDIEWYMSEDWSEETLRQSLLPKGKKSLPKEKPLVEPPHEPTLEELIGPKDSQTNRRYWKTMKCWPAEKNRSPLATAKAWLFVTKGDNEQEIEIFKAANLYRERFLPPKKPKDETCYMTGPLEWLTQGAWNNTLEEP